MTYRKSISNKSILNKSMSNKSLVFIVLLIIVGLTFLFFFLAGAELGFGDSVAVIPIEGVIATGQSSGVLEPERAVSKEIVALIDRAEQDSKIKAVLFEINSPGGTPVGSKEIADRIKRMEKYNIALIREMGASGAYWVASACDEVMANEHAIVGSIGVIGSYLEFSGFLEHYNITYQRLVAGKYKDMGSRFRKLSGDERDKLQQFIDTLHNYFMNEVAVNRNLTMKQVRKMATGEVFLGLEAIDLGLVDELGDRAAAEARFKEKLQVDEIRFVEYQRKRSIFDVLSEVMARQSFFLGKGIGSEIFVTGVNANPLATI